ncbi:MAG: pantoate--beta-alanine ligase [Ottowia sp.]|nr:pantoate--beta-alanine ligase [Ottowia sp.]
MHTVHTIAAARQQLAVWRSAGQTIALVPTMGNLHAGHLSLVHEARRQADRIVVSIFVNPTQFGPGEDLDSYPRTLARDADQLRAAGVDLLFAPEAGQMYPFASNLTWVDVHELPDHLCGRSRPQHFRGVTTVVSKLFHVTTPDVAVFGEKDFQQLTIVRRMTQELLLPIRIVGMPTVREADGLALSSRNSFLQPGQRRQAPLLYQHLLRARDAIAQGMRDYRALEQEMAATLADAGFKVDYVSVASAETLAPASDADRSLVVAAAAWLGSPRLIDNVTIQITG